MRKKQGFSSFEFYFVLVVISLIALVCMQRYFQLAEQVQRFSFELLAQHFNTSVYNARALWFLNHQQNAVEFSGVSVQMSEQGWPLSAGDDKAMVNKTMENKTMENTALGNKSAESSDVLAVVTVNSCKQLWLHLLQNPKPISYAGGDPLGSHPYHLLVTNDGQCRYQLWVKNSDQYYFDYSPKTGEVMLHHPVEQKD